jgi:phosphoribosyl-dephospho-CoA transferase
MPEIKPKRRAEERSAFRRMSIAGAWPAAYGGLRRCAANPPYVLPVADSEERLLRRHDLAWIDPSCLGVSCEEQAELRAWAHRRLPLVVGRQDGQPGGLRLGFTLPGKGPRRRVAVRVPRDAILVHGAPPPLEDMLAFAPADWQPRLEEAALAFQRVGLTSRVYGSLVTQAFSGEACLRPDSDIDLLIDCRGRADALAALSVLARHGEGRPRLDGELRLPHGWAVAWRELARSLAAGGQVLAKSDTDLQLMSPEDFLGATLPTGADHASPLHCVAAPV